MFAVVFKKQQQLQFDSL